jgi:hypothetical protein
VTDYSRWIFGSSLSKKVFSRMARAARVLNARDALDQRLALIALRLSGDRQ